MISRLTVTIVVVPVFLLCSSLTALTNAQFFQRVGRGSFETLPIPVYPIPLKQELTGMRFSLFDGVPIIIAEHAARGEKQASGYLERALAREEMVAAPIRQVPADAALKGPAIMIGIAGDGSPAAREAERRQWTDSRLSLKAEGYRLEVSPQGILLLGADARGLLYGAVTIMQLIRHDTPGDYPWVQGAFIVDHPVKPFRGIHVYLPSREDFPWFRSFAENVLLRLKMNTIIFEVSGGMEYRRHPEINIGWAEFSADGLRNGHQTGSDRHLPPQWRLREAREMGEWIGLDSPNSEPGGGFGVPQSEVRDLVDFLKSLGFNVIPEVQSLTHSYYLLTRHRELAEVPETLWPDSYNPADPRVYDLVGEVLDEVIDVFGPSIVCIGHDEWRSGGIHPAYKGEDTGKWYAKDVLWFRNYLNRHGIQTMIWGDIFEGFGPPDIDPKENSMFPSLKGAAEAVREGGGRDILAINWRFNHKFTKRVKVNPIEMTATYVDKQILGNFRAFSYLEKPEEYRQLAADSSVIGGAPSNWTINDEGATVRSGMLANYVAAGQLLWSAHDPSPRLWRKYIQMFVPQAKSRVQQRLYPSRLSAREDFQPLSLESAANAPWSDKSGGWDFAGVKPGRRVLGLIPFEFSAASREAAIVAVNRPGAANRRQYPYPVNSNPVTVGKKVASLVFCLATSDRALAVKPWFSAFVMAVNEPVGYLEIVYTDSLRTTVPLRYGLELVSWDEPDAVLYWSDVFPMPKRPETGVSVFEWVNPRPWREVAYVRLSGLQRTDGPRLPLRLGSGTGNGGDSDAVPLLLAVTACLHNVPPLEVQNNSEETVDP